MLPALGVVAIAIPIYYLFKPPITPAVLLVPVGRRWASSRCPSSTRSGWSGATPAWATGSARSSPTNNPPARWRTRVRRRASFRSTGRSAMTDTATRADQTTSAPPAGPGHRGRVPGRAGDHGGGRAAAGRRQGAGQVRLLRPGGTAQGRRPRRQAGRPPAARVPGQHRHRRVNRRGGLADRREGGQRAHAGPARRRPDADPRQRLRAGGRDRQGRPGLARGHGPARPARRQPDPGLPDHRGRVRATRGRPAPDGARARLRPGPGARPGLGPPGGRRRRLRRPDRQEGLQDHRRVRAGGPGRVRRLRRRGGPRPAAHHAAPDRDHPAVGTFFYPERNVAPVAGLVHADRVRRPRGPDPAPGQPARAPGDVPRLDPRDGRALRRPAVPLLAGLLRLGGVPGREVGQLARTRL